VETEDAGSGYRRVSPGYQTKEMFQKLDGMGLVEYRRYEGVVLPPA